MIRLKSINNRNDFPPTNWLDIPKILLSVFYWTHGWKSTGKIIRHTTITGEILINQSIEKISFINIKGLFTWCWWISARVGCKNARVVIRLDYAMELCRRYLTKPGIYFTISPIWPHLTTTSTILGGMKFTIWVNTF